MSTPVTITVDQSLCKRDGLCAKLCPSRIFRHEPKAVPTLERMAECVLCGHCVAVCTSDAISHSRLQVTAQRAIEEPHPVSAEVMRDFLRQRRSVRVYRKQPIPREVLTAIAESAGYAPTGAFGSAGWIRTVTVATGDQTMRKVREATVGYLRSLHKVLGGLMVKAAARFSAEARAGVATVPDLEMRLSEWDAGRDAVTYDAPAAIFVSASYDTTTPHEDCDAALMNMMLAAKSQGIGSCWNGWLGNAATSAHVRGPRVLGDLLGLPSNHHLCEAFTLGYPSFEVRRVPERVTSIRWCEG